MLVLNLFIEIIDLIDCIELHVIVDINQSISNMRESKHTIQRHSTAREGKADKDTR